MTKKDDAIEAYEFLLWNAKVREDALTLKVERLRQLNHELETENLDLRDTLEWRDERCAETYYELVELKAELAAAKQSLDYANQRLEEQEHEIEELQHKFEDADERVYNTLQRLGERRRVVQSLFDLLCHVEDGLTSSQRWELEEIKRGWK